MSNSRKKLKVDEVTDEQGRRRFHGAFTGGYSAGYFNTAGSAEGWAPSTFTSSRSNRAEIKGQNTKTYMDAEDGLFNNTLERTAEFDTFGTKAGQKISARAAALATGSIIPGPAPAELIVASSQAVGKRLLASMGWKEGQGLGPRLKSKRSSIVPVGINLLAIPLAANVGGVVTLAPENTKRYIVVPVAKSDLHGIGFMRTSLLGSIEECDGNTSGRGVYKMDAGLLSGASVGSKSAFLRDSAGFAYSDDVDDVYDDSGGSSLPPNTQLIEEIPLDTMDDSVAILKRKNIESRLGGFITDENNSAQTVNRCPSDNRVVLEGFSLAATPTEKPQEYPSIIVPKFFKPHHIFDGDVKWSGQSKVGVPYAKQSLESRSKLLSEGVPTEPQSQPGRDTNQAGGDKRMELIDSSTSVFSLLDDRGRNRIKAALSNPEKKNSESSFDVNTTAGLRVASEPPKLPAERPMLISMSVAKSVFSGVSTAFKSRFAPASDIAPKETGASEGGIVETVGLWHIDRKPDSDVSSTADSSKGVPGISQQTQKVVAPTNSSGLQVGSSRRVTTIWKPQPLLCKRMGIPVPAVSRDIPPHGQAAANSQSQQQSLGEMVGDNGDDRFRGSRFSSSSSSNSGNAQDARVSREDELYDKHIGQYMTQSETKVTTATAAPSNRSDAHRSTAAEENDDVPIEKTQPKPPKSLFKSIFEPDDSSDASSSDEDDSEPSDDERSELKQETHENVDRIGPHRPAVQDIDNITEMMSDTAPDLVAPTSVLPAKVVFKKPISATGATSLGARPNIFGYQHANRKVNQGGHKEEGGSLVTESVVGAKRGAAVLSFADDADDANETTLVLRPPVPRSIPSLAANITCASVSGGDREGNSSSDSSDSDSDNSGSETEHTPHSSWAPGLPMAVGDADKIKAKLQSIIEKKSSKNHKKKKSSIKKEKKEKKEKKHKSDSKKHSRKHDHHSEQKKKKHKREHD